MAVVATLVRALQLDDRRADNVCPGCGQDITGWEQADSHFSRPRPIVTREHTARREKIRLRYPLTNRQGTNSPEPVCPWDRDMLTARRFRRDYIAAASDSELGEALDHLDRTAVPAS